MNTVISPVNIEDRQKLGVKAGDTVRVWQKIEEKGKTRLQAFEGIVLARKHGNEAGATFTVRRVSGGVGVEKIFPLYSPAIDKIEIVKRAKVRRAKLYYIREKVAREIRRQMRNMNMVNLSTTSDIDEKAERDSAEAAASEEVAEETKDVEAPKTSSDEDVRASVKVEEAPKEEKAEEEAKEAPEEEKTEEKPSEE